MGDSKFPLWPHCDNVEGIRLGMATVHWIYFPRLSASAGVGLSDFEDFLKAWGRCGVPSLAGWKIGNSLGKLIQFGSLQLFQLLKFISGQCYVRRTWWPIRWKRESMNWAIFFGRVNNIFIRGRHIYAVYGRIFGRCAYSRYGWDFAN